MENENKYLSMAMTVVLTVVLVMVGVFAVLTMSRLANTEVKNTNGLGTGLTYNASTASYTDGADLRQNVQAMSEKMANVSQYQILQADSNGEMQAVAPSALAGTSWAFPEARVGSLVEEGGVVSLTASSTLTSAQVCDSGTISMTASGDEPTITLPATTTLFADCLTTNGDTLYLPILNSSSVTTTLVEAGSGGTMFSTTTLGVSTGSVLAVVRDATATYKAYILAN